MHEPLRSSPATAPTTAAPRRRTSHAPWWAPIALSVSFLTVLPAPRVEAGPAVVARAIGLFPAVGLALGGVLGAAGFVLDGLLPPGPTAALLLAAAAVLTGGLHLDGLLDTADGVFGGRSVGRRLEIMRDSRVGAFGVIAGGLALVGQYACLAELTGTARLTALAVAVGLGRWAMVLALGLFPAARATGLGATFREGVGCLPLAVATLVATGTALVAGRAGFAAFAVAAVVALLGGRFVAARLGGLTGDAYVALAVVAETSEVYVADVFPA